MITTTFNPLDTASIAKSICDELLRQPVMNLNDRESIDGAGIYALYYTGSFKLYHPISIQNSNCRFQQPIYVGKAIPSGSRKGGLCKTNPDEKALFKRMTNHSQTLQDIDNLNISDFWYRSLSLVEMWIAIGENGLIEKYQPLWNSILDGFGNKTPGKGRSRQQRSAWDTLHPGRRYVSDLNLPLNGRSKEDLVNRTTAFLAQHKFQTSTISIE